MNKIDKLSKLLAFLAIPIWIYNLAYPLGFKIPDYIAYTCISYQNIMFFPFLILGLIGAVKANTASGKICAVFVLVTDIFSLDA